MDAIVQVTQSIHETHPELYLLLTETPLFLSLHKTGNSESAFQEYLESLKLQLRTFNTQSGKNDEIL